MDVALENVIIVAPSVGSQAVMKEKEKEKEKEKDDVFTS